MTDPLKVTLRDRLLDGFTSGARLLPKGRTTAHRIMWRALGSPNRFLGTVDGQSFCVDATDTDISTHIYLWQEWEPPSSAVWLALLGAGQVVVDVGANKGWFSLLAARRVLPGGRVISYEPLPRNAADLSSTIAANGHSHWTVRTAAASDHAGTAQLVSPSDSSGSGWGSLEKAAGGGTVAIDVPIVELATDLAAQGVARVDLLKMDIEGHELAALTGLLPMLRAGSVSTLLVEIHKKALGEAGVAAILTLMADCGYRAFWLDESVMTEHRWRKAMRSPPDSALLDLLPEVNGPGDPLIRDLGYYKLLWRR